MSVKIDWGKFWNLMAASKRILLTSHIRSDGDSLGSQLAMAEALEAMGKEVILVNSDPVPPSLTFMDPNHRIKGREELSEEEIQEMKKADFHLILDLSSWAQLGKMADIYRDGVRNKGIIDHHESTRDLPGDYFADPAAEATGALVFDAIEASPVTMTKSMAFNIFVAMATDTGWFRFQSSTPSTYRKAACLMERGVSPAEVYKIVYEQESLSRIRLTGYALAKTEPHLDGALMVTSLLLSDFDAAGAHPSESEDIVNMTLAVKGTKMAIILVEQRTGGFKISFRSRCAVDCSQLARKFGGGGHAQAAGAFINQPYDEAKSVLLAAITEEWEAVRGVSDK